MTFSAHARGTDINSALEINADSDARTVSVVSNKPLFASELHAYPANVTVGQIFTVTMTVSNVGLVDASGVTASVLTAVNAAQDGTVSPAIARHAHLLQPFDAEILDPVRHSRPYAGMILVDGHALNEVALSVEVQAVGRVKDRRSYAKRRAVNIRAGVLIADGGGQLVEIGRLWRPQVGVKRNRLRHD